MAIELFGFRFGKTQDSPVQNVINQPIPSFTPPPNMDGAVEVAPGGAYGTFIDLEGTAKTESELITKYRELAIQAEAEYAIDDIVNESIIHEDHKPLVEINLDDIDNLTDKIKHIIRDEFKTCLRLLDFQNMGYDIFRRWYIDGRLYYHMMIDEAKPREGIQELRYIDPRRIRKVREPVRRSVNSGVRINPVAPVYNEYYMYVPAGIGIVNPIHNINTTNSLMNVRISKDSIVYVHSGVNDQRNRMILSHLHKALKPMNQLRMLEDAVVIYRLARAPERRVFYIDVGNLPKMKAEQYLRDMMSKHKNKLVYNASTGEIRDDRKHMTMLEDFWLPRREGNRGTEITTLPGGQNLGQMEDVDYFRRKLYKSLGVPTGRLMQEGTFSFGKAAEITRDEIKFSRQIDRLRLRFSHLFDNILETQLVLRGVMNKEEFALIKENIHYDFLRDNYFAELKDQEIVTTRLSILQNIEGYVGKYFSKKYIQTNILQMTEEDIEDIQKEIEEEGSNLELIQNQQADPQNAPPNKAAAFAKLKPKINKNSSVKEAFIPRELSEDDKKLIERMTNAIDIASGELLNDDYQLHEGKL